MGVWPRSAYVEVGPPGLQQSLRVRFGPWSLSTTTDNIKNLQITREYAFIKTAGPPRLSAADTGVTFATNGDVGVCVCFHEPVRMWPPFTPRGHEAMTVTVAEVEAFVDALGGLHEGRTS